MKIRFIALLCCYVVVVRVESLAETGLKKNGQLLRDF